ncbi:hypothetical protein ABZ721_11330 [Streptomyces sp. NPDC006733]|uniref:hypothetical protein n=1 Tax=Streptomyces sp. NPDC006733 TaxID=3155460 RepID=UPI0033CAF59E
MTGRTAAVAGRQSLALAMPDRNSWLIIIGFLTALVLLIWVVSRIIRSQGGFRRTCRRVVWEARMTGRAFSQPLRAYRLHRRCARMLTSFLADPDARVLAGAALDRADAAQGAGCYAPTVWIGPSRDRTRVVIAGRDPLGPSGAWTDAAADPGEWTWSAPAQAEPSATAALEEDRERLLLVVGVDRKVPGVVLVDWASGPSSLVVEGDARVARSVVHALTAQLDSLPDGPEVLVARGLHPRFPGPGLDDLIAEVSARGSVEAVPVGGPDEGTEAETGRVSLLPPVLACWMPNPEQAERLAALSADGSALVLAGGSLPGSSWTLHAEPDGRLLGPGMQIDVEAASLAKAVGRAIRRQRSRARATAPATTPVVTSEAAEVSEVSEEASAASAAAETPTPAPVEPVSARTGTDDPDFIEPAATPAATPAIPAPAPAPDSHAHPVAKPGAGPVAKPDQDPAPEPTAVPPPAPAPAPAPAHALDPDLDLAEPEPAAAPARSAGVSAASRPLPAAPGEIPDRTAPTS